MIAFRTRTPVALVATAAILVAACSGSGSPTPSTAASESPAGSPAASSSPVSSEPIKIGFLATLSGAFAGLGEDSLRGAEIALNEVKDPATGKYMVAGREILVIKEGTDATAAVALEKAKKLVEQDNVDIVIGPLSGDEGIAVKDYSLTVPDKTFVNGVAGATEISWPTNSPNFFNFAANGPQQIAGLGNYVYNVKGYKTVATVGEDYSYPYSNIGGFMYQFCPAGGRVVQKNWVPIGTKDFSSVIARLPKDIDAVMVALGGADAVNFFKQYTDSGGTAKFIGGSISVDQNVLSTQALPAERLVGLVSAASTADLDPEKSWTDFVSAYNSTFPEAPPYPGLFSTSYYNATKAVLMALAQVNGDLSNDQAQLMQALAKTVVPGPTGNVSLDDHLAAILSAFVVEVQQSSTGELQTAVMEKVENVNQILNLSPTDPLVAQPVSRDWPSCP